MSRVIVVTGGTAGVGRAVARRFAAHGDWVAVLARGRDGLKATVAEIDQLGGQGLGLAADFTDAGQVDAAAERIERALGPIDVWINNAIVTAVGPVESISTSETQRITDACDHGFMWGTRAALHHMRPRNRGIIIQVGSALANRSIPLHAACWGATHAFCSFTDALRSELQHDGVAIEVCMVQLPAANTPQFDGCMNRMDKALQPVPPIVQPEIIAEAVHDVSHHPRREVFLGWPAIRAIVGQKLVPGLADR